MWDGRTANTKQKAGNMPRKDRTVTIETQAPDQEQNMSDETNTNDTTNDIQTQANDVAAAATKKRARVDVDKLAAENPNSKVTLSIQVPAAMRIELRKLAEADKVDESEFVRGLLASRTGYQIPADFVEKRGRRALVGLTEEEKKAERKKQQEAQRDNVTNLLALVQSGAFGLSPEDLKEKYGIDVTALPKTRKKSEAVAE